MRLVGRQLVQKEIAVSPNSQRASDLRAWLSIVENSKWLGATDLVADHPGAFSAGNMWTFPLQKSRGFVKALVGFRGSGQVIVKEVF